MSSTTIANLTLKLLNTFLSSKIIQFTFLNEKHLKIVLMSDKMLKINVFVARHR
jgi:hypothetical protein